MGFQYTVGPLLIAEHQWHIAGIETPVIPLGARPPSWWKGYSSFDHSEG